MKQFDPNIHLIGNAHIDPIWLWRLPEGLSEIKATFRSALDRMKEFDGFIFTSACASYYLWLEHNEPELFAEIQARVAEGRWVLAGGMWVQPDCNIPCGESFARHLLYSQRYFREKFGKIATVGYNVDSFGHNGMLPQLLRQAGIDSYVYLRPNTVDEKPELQAHLFRWQSPDGSEVLAYHIPKEYSDRGFDLEMYNGLVQERGVPYMAFYGVGNHGGGPTIRRLEELSGLISPQMQFSSPETYFAAVRKSGLYSSLPVVQEELQHHASGCYSASSAIKQSNRRAETALLSAEVYNALSLLLRPDTASRQSRLREAWKKLLFFQFHDALAGCCIRSACHDILLAMNGVADTAEEATCFSLNRISWHIGTHRQQNGLPGQRNGWRFWEKEGEGAPVVVFNPHSFPVRRPVLLNTGKASAVCDAQGQFLPLQEVRGPAINRGVSRNYLFLAEVPPLGYRTYYVYKELEQPRAFPSELHVEECVLENQLLRVEFDRTHGWISRLVSKTDGVVHNAGPLARMSVLSDDDHDTWAHGVFAFEQELGSFSTARFRILETGLNRVGLRVTSTYGASSLEQDFYLYSGADAVEVHCKLFLAERSRIFRLCFHSAVDTPAVLRRAIANGTLEQTPTGNEEPTQCWADLHDARGGLAVISDSKYSFSAVGAELRMIAARTCCYALHFHGRDDLAEYQDLGEHAFRYLIHPHKKAANSQLTRLAALLQTDIRWNMETFHDGPLPPQYSAFSCTADNISLETIKQPESGSGLIVRLLERDGLKTDAEIHVMGNRIHVHFQPFELKTFRICDGEAPVETNLLEDVL